MKRSLRRLTEALLGLLIVAAAVAWLSGGFGERIAPGRVLGAETARPEGAVEATVKRVSRPAVEWASGALASARRTIVAARILARIEEVKVRAGDRVARGDVLIVLESRDLEARVAQAREALRAAEARLALARTEKERFEKLFRRGVASRQRLDQAVAALNGAEADVMRLRERLGEARTALSYTVIRSPVSGRIVDRLAEPGETAAPGQPLLRIYDPTVLRIEAPVRESLAVKLRVGNVLRVQVPALDVLVDGTIDEIVPFAEPGARTLLVKVRLPSDERLFAGMFARLAVPAGVRTRLLVPTAAIARIGQLEFATVVAPDGQLERRLVTTGAYRENGRVEVLSGLAAGERVLFTPVDRS